MLVNNSSNYRFRIIFEYIFATYFPFMSKRYKIKFNNTFIN